MPSPGCIRGLLAENDRALVRSIVAARMLGSDEPEAILGIEDVPGRDLEPAR